ncbi:ROK family protein [Pseudochrobactrum kiredjianiae]|uniref:ROK family protein n=1 Tax=Pseudochrobactrum kiredjianiae TaxID=386305 RepID=A0ABW3V7C5_9HYPH|nr:ROK family protein [Pseudochrobactrum kiredjianiae]MDM7853044.1 ROK family protein [Pseudochrobactrum kiredjianiae]
MQYSETSNINPVFAADVGGSFIRLAFSPKAGELVSLDKVTTPVDDWSGFVQALKTLLNKHGRDHQAPLALSIAGLIDPADGRAFSANIPCINGHQLDKELEQHLGRRVVAVNDADSLALAEAGEGAGRGHRVVFCAVLGTGVGGGLVTDGRLVRGAGGIAGEWGHGPILNTMLELEGETTPLYIPRFSCGCGQKGCVDTIGGARGIERLHSFLHGEERDSRTIVTGWERDAEKPKRTIEVYLHLMADPLAAVINITGASIVPVGGGLATAETLIHALDTAVRSRILRRTDQRVVVSGRFRNEGGLIGAAISARQLS